MRSHTVTVHEGEDVGPIDWSHEIAKDMPPIWREAEKSPDNYLFRGKFPILRICMYDGWPYWKPMPAVCFLGPLNSAEWNYFNSYSVYPDSITKKPLAISMPS